MITPAGFVIAVGGPAAAELVRGAAAEHTAAWWRMAAHRRVALADTPRATLPSRPWGALGVLRAVPPSLA